MEKRATITLFCQHCLHEFSFIGVGQKIPQVCQPCAMGAMRATLGLAA